MGKLVANIDDDVKARAAALYDSMGMSLTTAVNIFIRQSLRQGGIPFNVSLDEPNRETVSAMLEAKRIARDGNVKGYRDLNALFKDLDA